MVIFYGFILRMEPPSPQLAESKKGEVDFTFLLRFSHLAGLSN